MSLPTLIYWTLDGRPIDGEWTEAVASRGGYHRASVRVPRGQAARGRQGSILKAWQSNGRVMWEGRLITAPAVSSFGFATLEAVGYKTAAEKNSARLLYLTTDPGVWEDNGSTVGFSIVGSDIIAAGAGTLALKLLAYFPGVALARYDNTATGVYFGVDKGGWQAALTGGYVPAGGPYNSVKVDITTAAAGAVTVGPIYGSGNTSDTMTTSAVVSDIGSRLGWDVAGIQTSNRNALPLDLQGAWASALDYMASLDDWQWRVLDDRGSGPVVEYTPWEREFHAYIAAGTAAEFIPLELFNQVRVYYSDGTDSPKNILVEAVPDPLAGTGLVNTYSYELQDEQANTDLAYEVAYDILDKVSTQRYMGQVVVPQVDEGTPFDILPGDLLTVPDWQGNQAVTGRVAEVSYSPTGVSVGIEQPTSVAAALLRFVQPGAETAKAVRSVKVAPGTSPSSPSGTVVPSSPFPGGTLGW